jgi:geranylgeranyl pyrophosphate synthase
VSTAPAPDSPFTAALEYSGVAVDRFLESFLSLPEQVGNLHDAARYSMGLDVEDRVVRGKRVRPALCLLTTEALGTDPDLAIPFAAAIELLHNFALVHDDIQDGDTIRRGRPAVWQRYGLAHGINVGDYMLAKVYQIILRDEGNPGPVRDRLLGVVEHTLEELFAGQALDITARETNRFTLADYEHIVSKKTGSYLAAPMLGGAIVAGAEPGVLSAISRLGAALGPLFQIKDDLIDLSSGKGRGAVGNDVREGKRSWMVGWVAERCTPEEHQLLFSTLDRSRDSTSPDDVTAVIDLFTRRGALAAAESRCEELRLEALAVLSELPIDLREPLEDATNILARRST